MKKIFCGEEYVLNQTETPDILEWYEKSKAGEYTNFYERIFFHTVNGLYCAYRNNLSNFVKC